MRFDYVHDGRPDALERLRPSRIPEQLRTPLAALLTTAIVVCAWWGIEQFLLAQARDDVKEQSFRLTVSAAALSQAKIRQTRVETLLVIDSRLREIRRSGAALASGLADIANHVPNRAWLTSIARVDDGLEIDGRAEGLDGLSETLADLMSSSHVASPDLVRASKEDGDRTGRLIAFVVRVGELR